ncbi:hypothetical protein ACTG9Q_24720 [Actinokineospora sp. 24-640]
MQAVDVLAQQNRAEVRPNIEQQSQFFMGYHHQRGHVWDVLESLKAPFTP